MPSLFVSIAENNASTPPVNPPATELYDDDSYDGETFCPRLAPNP